MINNNRIVPIVKTNLLAMYGVILKVHNSGTTKLEATNIGEFSVTTTSARYLANEPLKKLNFGSDVTASDVFFIADNDYQGFTKDGATLTIADNGVTVEKGTDILYRAVLSANTLTITSQSV